MAPALLAHPLGLNFNFLARHVAAHSPPDLFTAQLRKLALLLRGHFLVSCFEHGILHQVH